MSATRIEELNGVVMNAINELRELKKHTPSLRAGVKLEPGSILNAYREGDLSFSEAKVHLDEAYANMSVYASQPMFKDPT